MCGECDLIYVYDGSFEGMLSCIFAAFANRETPARIVADDELQPSLFARRPVETDPEHARRLVQHLSLFLLPMLLSYYYLFWLHIW